MTGSLVVPETQVDETFPDMIESLSGGEKVRICMQCGTCSASCPFSGYMEDTPRAIMAMILSGLRGRVLASDTIWYCASCYTCAVRCPRGINLPEVMYVLKRMAIVSTGGSPTILFDCFNHVLKSFGRLYEEGVLMHLAARSDPLMLVAYGPLGVKMYLRQKIKLAEKSRALEDIRALYGRVIEMEGSP